MIQFIFRLIGLVISLVISVFVLLFILGFGFIFFVIWLLTGRKKISPFGNANFKVFNFDLRNHQRYQKYQNTSTASDLDQESNIRDVEVIDVQAIEIEHQETSDKKS